MYYQNGNYMQDLNYYNQMPAMGYQPYANQPYSNPNVNPVNQPMPNLNAMYPAVYRIIAPVVSQVLANSNTNYLSEEALNNMVDTVYDMVEGDINVKSNATRLNSNHASNENTSSGSCERNSSTSRPNTSATPATYTDSQNALLKDLIKIMILNELNCRRQSNFNTMSMQNSNMTQPMFQSYNF